MFFNVFFTKMDFRQFYRNRITNRTIFRFSYKILKLAKDFDEYESILWTKKSEFRKVQVRLYRKTSNTGNL